MTSEYDPDSLDSRNLQSWRVPNEINIQSRNGNNNTTNSALSSPKINNLFNISVNQKKNELSTTSTPSNLNNINKKSISIEVECNPNTSYIPKNSNNLDMRKQYWSLLWLQFNQCVDTMYSRVEQESFIPQCKEVINAFGAVLTDFEKLLERLQAQEPVQRQLENETDLDSSERPRPRSLAWEVRKTSTKVEDYFDISRIPVFRSRLENIPSPSPSPSSRTTTSYSATPNNNGSTLHSPKLSYQGTPSNFDNSWIHDLTLSEIPSLITTTESHSNTTIRALASPDRVSRKISSANRIEVAEINRNELMKVKKSKSRDWNTKLKNVIHRRSEKLENKKLEIDKSLEKAEELHDFHVKKIQLKAANENEKVSEVAFINQLGAEFKKMDIANRLEMSSRRREDFNAKHSRKKIHEARNSAVNAKRRAMEEDKKQNEKRLEESEVRRKNHLSTSNLITSPKLNSLQIDPLKSPVALELASPHLPITKQSGKKANRSLLKQLESLSDKVFNKFVEDEKSSKNVQKLSPIKQKDLVHKLFLEISSAIAELNIDQNYSVDCEKINDDISEIYDIFLQSDTIALCLKDSSFSISLASQFLIYLNLFYNNNHSLSTLIINSTFQILRVLKQMCSFSKIIRTYLLSNKRMTPIFELLRNELDIIGKFIPTTAIPHFFSNLSLLSDLPVEYNYSTNLSNLLSIISMVLLEPVSVEIAETSKYHYFQFIYSNDILSRVNLLFDICNKTISNKAAADDSMMLLILQIVFFLEAITKYYDISVSNKPVYEPIFTLTSINDNALKQKVNIDCSWVSKTTENISISTLLSLLTALSLEHEQKFGWTPRHNRNPSVFSLMKNNSSEISDTVIRIVLSVFCVLNNIARLDLIKFQTFDSNGLYRGELYHLLSFWMKYTTIYFSKSLISRVLLHQIILFIGYFTLLNDNNQETFRWGKPPTILHRLCNLPFSFFSDENGKRILFPTLISLCFRSNHNQKIINEEINSCFLVNFIIDEINRPILKVDNIQNASNHINSNPDSGVSNGEELTSAIFQFQQRFPAELRQEALEFFGIKNHN